MFVPEFYLNNVSQFDFVYIFSWMTLVLFVGIVSMHMEYVISTAIKDLDTIFLWLGSSVL